MKQTRKTAPAISFNEIPPAIRERFHKQDNIINGIVLNIDAIQREVETLNGFFKQEIVTLNKAREQHNIDIILIKNEYLHTIKLIERLEASFKISSDKIETDVGQINLMLKTLNNNSYISKGSMLVITPAVCLLATLSIEYLYKFLFGN